MRRIKCAKDHGVFERLKTWPLKGDNTRGYGSINVGDQIRLGMGRGRHGKK
jgi:hypothetical protein